MDPQLVALALAVPAAFVAGVIFNRYVISEASAIKTHVTSELDRLRDDVKQWLSGVAGKL